MKQPALLWLLLVLSTWIQAADETPPPLPLPVASFGAASTSDGALYFYGGHSGKRHRYNRDEVHGTLYRWQAGDKGWQALPKDEPAQGASLLAVPGGLIRIGGMAARNAPGEKQELWSSDTVSRFDLQSQKWQPLPKMPQRRSSHDSTLVGDVIYVMGGWHLQAEQDTLWHDTYLTLDLKHLEAGWKQHPQPFKRRALAIQAVGDQIYAIGGMTDDDAMSVEVSILDTTTGQWKKSKDLPKDKVGGFGFAAVSHEGKLFTSGAPGEVLVLKEGQWSPIAKLKHPRFFHRLLSGGAGKLLAIGGESRDGVKAPPEVITLPKN